MNYKWVEIVPKDEKTYPEKNKYVWVEWEDKFGRKGLDVGRSTGNNEYLWTFSIDYVYDLEDQPYKILRWKYIKIPEV